MPRKGERLKPIEETADYKKRQAATLRRKLKHRATLQRREMARRATKDAIDKVAGEAFGEGGLTPARREALAAVVAGPDSHTITIASPAHLKVLIRKAKEKLTEKDEEYIDNHAKAVSGALAKGEFDVAARHAEWAMEAIGDGDDRVIERPLKIATGNGQAPIMVGVNLGGMSKG